MVRKVDFDAMIIVHGHSEEMYIYFELKGRVFDVEKSS